MRILIAALIAALVAYAATAAPKKPEPAKASAPLAPAVMPPNVVPTPANPAGVVMWRPDQPGLLPLGPGTTATTPSVNIAADQVQPPGQNTMANSPSVTLASDQQVGDPCTFTAKKTKPITTTALNLQLVAPVAGQNVYICAFKINAAAAANWNLIEGTGALCVTANEAAIIGSTVAANGMAVAANNTDTYGSGTGTVGQTNTAGNGVCLLQSTAVDLSGNIVYVQQ